MKILLTAFGPFHNFSINPSDEILKLLMNRLKNHFTEFEFHSKVLDVSYQSVDCFLDKSDLHYDYIFHMGVASYNEKISIEFWPKNYVKGTDIANVSKDSPIDSHTDKFLKTDKAILDKCLDFVESSAIMKDSYDAGNYLCNYIFYKSMKKFKESTVLFLHVSDYVNNDLSPDMTAQATELFNFICHIIPVKTKELSA